MWVVTKCTKHIKKKHSVKKSATHTHTQFDPNKHGLMWNESMSLNIKVQQEQLFHIID